MGHLPVYLSNTELHMQLFSRKLRKLRKMKTVMKWWFGNLANIKARCGATYQQKYPFTFYIEAIWRFHQVTEYVYPKHENYLVPPQSKLQQRYKHAS